jgi:amino acid transporter
VQALISGLVLLASQINQSTRDSYQQLIDSAIILYFIPFLYMFAAAIRLARRRDRAENEHAVLIPGGLVGVWTVSGVAFLITLLSIVLSVFPPGESSNRVAFLLRTLGWVISSMAIGLTLYCRGVRAKKAG